MHGPTLLPTVSPDPSDRCGSPIGGTAPRSISAMSVLVSVEVPVFNPGENFDPLMESLQRQTMPQSDFETIFVERLVRRDAGELDRLAAAHDNVHVIHIPNARRRG